MSTRGRNVRLAGSAVALIIATGVALRTICLLWARGMMIDDAYITVRCAQNLLAGQGLVYNGGEHVLATTSPLYALFAAAAMSVAGEASPGYLLGALNIAAFAAGALLLADLASDFGRRATLLVLIFFAGYVAFVDNATTGMETSVFILGLALSLWLLRRGRTGWTSLVVGLLILVRPEAIVWAAALGAGAYIAGKPIRPVSLIPGLAVVAAWSAVSLPFYGSVVPHCVSSKCGWIAPYMSGPFTARFGATFSSLALLDFRSIVRDPTGAAFLRALGPLSAVAFAVGTIVLVRARKLAVSLPLLFIGYMAFYLAVKGRIDFSWYGIPSGLAYWATCAVGVGAVAKWTLRPGFRERAARAALPIVAVALVVTTVWCWRSARLPYYRLLKTSYEAAASLIDESAPQDARVLIDEAGMLGYAGHRYMVDLDGLVSPDVMEFRRAHGWWCPLSDIVVAVDPDLIALSLGNLEQLMEGEGAATAMADYETLGAFEGHIVVAKKSGAVTLGESAPR